MRTYVRSRAWSAEDLDAAEARLVERGLIADGAFTDQGRTAREQVEILTDRACQPIVDNLGPDGKESVGKFSGGTAAIGKAGGYPGPGHNLAPRLARPRSRRLREL